MPCCWWSWVSTYPLGGSCAALGLRGRRRRRSGPHAERVSQQQIHTLGVSTGACWDGCHARGGGVCRKPCVCACAWCLLNTWVYFATKRLCICVMLCASHRYSLKSQMVVVLDLEKNIAARGKGLAKASLPSNHLAEAGAGALWGPEGMRLPLTLEEKQIKM